VGFILADQVLDGDAKRPGQGRQQRHGNAQPPCLVVGKGLLGDAEFIGELHLGEIARLASRGDAPAERQIEALVGDGHEAALKR